MTIAYVLKTYPRLSQTFIVNEILAHEAGGLALRIEALKRPGAEDSQADVAAVRAPVHYLGDVAAGIDAQAAALAARVRRDGIAHLHAHFGNRAAEVARRAAAAAGIGYSFTAHARDIFLDGVDHDALARRLREAARVVTVSDFNLAHLNARYRLPAGHVVRIYNGLDLRRLPPASARERAPIVFAVGRLIEKKGFADLVDACARLRAQGRRLRCVIAGSGPLREALERQIEALGVADHVKLVGAVAPATVLRWMRRAAAFAAPCVVGADGDRDGLPTVLLEAMAVGCPCVSTDVTGIPELLRHDDNGLMVPQRDPDALAAALARLLDDGALRERLARRARARIEADFDIHRNTERLRAIFHACEARSRQAALVA